VDPAADIAPPARHEDERHVPGDAAEEPRPQRYGSFTATGLERASAAVVISAGVVRPASRPSLFATAR